MTPSMKYIFLIPAALVAVQAHGQGIKLPITPENHKAWMRCLANQRPGEVTIAILMRDVVQEGGYVLAVKGSKLHGVVAKDGTSSTFTKLIHPDGEPLIFEPFTIKGLLKEGE